MSEVQEEKGKVGRPKGSAETPESLLRSELLKQLKLFQRLREIVEKRLKDTPETELKTDDLNGLMDLLLKGIVQMSKVVVAPQKATSERSEEEEDAEKILERIMK